MGCIASKFVKKNSQSINHHVIIQMECACGCTQGFVPQTDPLFDLNTIARLNCPQPQHFIHSPFYQNEFNFTNNPFLSLQSFQPPQISIPQVALQAPPPPQSPQLLPQMISHTPQTQISSFRVKNVALNALKLNNRVHNGMVRVIRDRLFI